MHHVCCQEKYGWVAWHAERYIIISLKAVGRRTMRLDNWTGYVSSTDGGTRGFLQLHEPQQDHHLHAHLMVTLFLTPILTHPPVILVQILLEHILDHYRTGLKVEVG